MYELINISSLSTVVKETSYTVSGNSNIGSRPNRKQQIFSLPGRAQLFVLFSPSTACHLTSPTRTVSFRSPSYHLPRLFTGFSETVGIATLLMKNVLSTTFCLTIEMLLDLEGLNCIHAHSILSVILPNNRLVQATVVVMVVMLSMYALIGASRIPEAKRSPLTTHLDALMILNFNGKSQRRNGEMEFWSCETKLQIPKKGFH